jgi:hypothetical protein
MTSRKKGGLSVVYQFEINRMGELEKRKKVIPVAAGLDSATAPKRLRLVFGYDARLRRVMKGGMAKMPGTRDVSVYSWAMGACGVVD